MEYLLKLPESEKDILNDAAVAVYRLTDSGNEAIIDLILRNPTLTESLLKLLQSGPINVRFSCVRSIGKTTLHFFFVCMHILKLFKCPHFKPEKHSSK